MNSRSHQRQVYARVLFCTVVVCLTTSTLFSQAPTQPTGNRPDVLGLALASKLVELKSSVPGRIDALDVEEFDPVAAGQVIARIDDAEPRVRVERARLSAETTTNIELARLEVEATAHQVEKLQSLERSASKWELKQAEIALKQAEVRVKLEEEAYELAQTDLRYTQAILDKYSIRAPFNGRVIRLLVEAGVSVEIDDPLMIIAQLDPLEAHLYLPLDWYDKLKVGDSYRLMAGTPVDGEVIGVVKNLDLQIDPASQTFRAVFTIKNPDEKLPAKFQITGIKPMEAAQ